MKQIEIVSSEFISVKNSDGLYGGWGYYICHMRDDSIWHFYKDKAFEWEWRQVTLSRAELQESLDSFLAAEIYDKVVTNALQTIERQETEEE